MPFMNFSPAAMQPTQPALQGMGAVQKPPAFPATPRPMGFLGRIGQVLTPDRLRAIGAGLHDLSTGSNTLPDLLAQLDEQRAQLEQQRWQRIQEDHAMLGWKRQAQQYQAQDDLVNAAPAELQPYVRAAPDTYAEGAIRSALRPSGGRPMTAEEARAYNLEPRTSGWIDAEGNPHVLQNPYHPPASLMGSGTDAPFTPNPAGVGPSADAPPVGTVEEGYRYLGGNPADPSSWEAVR